MSTASSQALADRTAYPYTVRVYPGETSRLVGVAAFLKEMGWRRIAFIFEENAAYQNVRLFVWPFFMLIYVCVCVCG